MRVVYPDSHQHTFEDELVRRLIEVGALFDVYHCLSEDDSVEFCRGADALLSSQTLITARVIEAMPRCRVIARVGTGYDNIDLQAAGAQGIPVTNVPNFCTDEVANHTIALLLACDRTIVERDREIRDGVWKQFELVHTGRRLTGRMLGLVGYGTIGQAVARRAQAFGLQIAFFDPHLSSPPDQPLAQRHQTLDELLRSADFVSLHVTLNESTHHLIGAEQLQRMKDSAILINTARGGVVNERELIEALRSGSIGGAGLDVFEEEPLSPTSPLVQMENVVLSPHTAAHTIESMKDLRSRAVDEVVRALQGEPLKNIVNSASLRGTDAKTSNE